MEIRQNKSGKGGLKRIWENAKARIAIIVSSIGVLLVPLKEVPQKAIKVFERVPTREIHIPKSKPRFERPTIESKSRNFFGDDILRQINDSTLRRPTVQSQSVGGRSLYDTRSESTSSFQKNILLTIPTLTDSMRLSSEIQQIQRDIEKTKNSFANP